MLKFFSRPIFSDRRTIAVVWLVIVIVAFLTKGAFNPAKCNNFLIYCGVFDHLREQLPLYVPYPGEYNDLNHYGPVFGLIIAPFAVLPHALGLFLWDLLLAGLLFAAVFSLPISRGKQAAVAWICTLEVLSALQMQQFNLVIAAAVAATFVNAVCHDRPGTAAYLVAVTAFVKIYSIIGIVFLPFMRRKWRFLGWLVVWSAVMFVAPMLISSPEYVVGQYHDWFAELMTKNSTNSIIGASNYQNISAIGMIHRISGAAFSDLWVLLPAGLLFLLPFANRRVWRSDSFRWGILASALMCIILFSTGSESSGYVIAFLGIGIWFTCVPALSGRHIDGWKIGLLVAALLICGFGGSDIVPSAVRKGIIRAYALKALPVLLIWLYLTATLIRLKPETEHT